MSKKQLNPARSLSLSRRLSFRWSPKAKASSDYNSANGPRLNGFDTIPEVPAVSLPDEQLAPFTLPLEVLTKTTTKEDTHHRFASGALERRLFQNTELEVEEQRLLQEMQAAAKSRGQAFLPFMTSQANRFLHQAKGNVDSALDTMQSIQDWRLEFFKTPFGTPMVEDLAHGFVYWCGRDSMLRPTLVFRANRIPEEWKKNSQWDRVVSAFLFCLEYALRYMLVPGKVESWNIIIDLAGMGLRQIPVSALQAIQKKTGSTYPGRINKFYLVRMSKFLSPLISVGKSMMNERQIQKLSFVKDVQSLAEDFALTQLEKDFGGSRDTPAQFFPFPLPPGPFTAGFSGQADSKAVPNMHKVLCEDCARGSLWDSRLEPKENMQLPFSPEWAELLAGFGISVPRSRPSECGSLVSHSNNDSNNNNNRRDANGDVIREASASSNGSYIVKEDGTVLVRL
mmetsp:Transcript_17728/g.41237  ORF Transcript_17728/g.41237 Transcript_17728/m.41237 type:complete len:453 (+) Transcript_17728:130-1488(+)